MRKYKSIFLSSFRILTYHLVLKMFKKEKVEATKTSINNSSESFGVVRFLTCLGVGGQCQSFGLHVVTHLCVCHFSWDLMFLGILTTPKRILCSETIRNGIKILSISKKDRKIITKKYCAFNKKKSLQFSLLLLLDLRSSVTFSLHCVENKSVQFGWENTESVFIKIYLKALVTVVGLKNIIFCLPYKVYWRVHILGMFHAIYGCKSGKLMENICTNCPSDFDA